ncbi:zinc ribbon domain-containing protein [Bremerella sp. T1]|uniref:zinc ribbon domain-containing protein n=1 Tax=Bremerella sp. TYQ1 TaxID=3119568 RepID=UPI001CCC0FDE|nr:zinc ribbon domain-containing protein [Bremerella volcania]UBM37975.1 zinc ribbon domain-containing protein [Bremerella volcania]
MQDIVENEEPLVAAESVADDGLVAAEIPQPHGEPCPACGCPVEPNDKFCPACGTPHEVQVPAKSSTGTAATIKKYFHCETCGANVSIDPQELSYVCPFCDSTYVVEYSPEVSGRQLPEFVIPFRVTPEMAMKKFRAWIKGNDWYRPGDLHLAEIEDKLRGVYLPFWSFSMLAESHWRASIGEYWYKTESYTTMENGKMVRKTRRVQKTEWWPLSGRHHKYYSGYMISASKGLTQADADRIKPFSPLAAKRYEPYFLAGWAAEEYQMEIADAQKVCYEEFYRREQSNIRQFLPGDTSRSLVVQTEFSYENSDLYLLPIYVLTYRYKDQVFRFLVNGQTGLINGDKPVSWKRIWAAVGGGVGLLILFILIVLLLSAVLN